MGPKDHLDRQSKRPERSVRPRRPMARKKGGGTNIRPRATPLNTSDWSASTKEFSPRASSSSAFDGSSSNADMVKAIAEEQRRAAPRRARRR